MDAAKQYGDENVLCIFDENFDNYKEGEYVPTDAPQMHQ